MRQRSAINPFATSPSPVSPAEGVTAAQPAEEKTASSGPWTEHTWKWRGHSIHYKVRPTRVASGWQGVGAEGRDWSLA